MTDAKAAPSVPRSSRSRLSTALYGVAFVCVLVAGAILAFAAKEFFKTTVTLWVSVGFSAVAIVLAVVSLFRGRRS